LSDRTYHGPPDTDTRPCRRAQTVSHRILPARFCSEDEVRNKRKSHHLPVKLVDGFAYLTFKGSGLITSITHADGLVAIEEDVTLTEGEVDVRVL
jgi:molybdopterin biosynthesis enzyme